jgi:hypothetical protein
MAGVPLNLARLNELRDELVNALASGTRRVRDQNGEEIEFRSANEIVRALRDIEARIAAVKAGGAVPTTYRFNCSKGT